MEKKLLAVTESIASILAQEKAYNIPNTCSRYGLGNGEDYSSPSSKERYLWHLLKDRDDKFILDLAKRVVEDYKSDHIAFALNDYYDGKFFKLSVITRKELLAELFRLNSLEGNLSKKDFLTVCSFENLIPFEGLDFLSLPFGGATSQNIKAEIDLTKILSDANLYRLHDERFFQFLEQIVHPYTRPNMDCAPYISAINQYLQKDSLSLIPTDEISGQLVYTVTSGTGVTEPVKNLIFASNKYKPEIILEDALSNRIKIVRNSEFCLVYDKPIKATGLLWVELVQWWADLQSKPVDLQQAQDLKLRLFCSLASEPEKVLFESYFKSMGTIMKRKLPVLIPQVYLHYDPYSIKKHGIQYLLRQRMDFLLLLSNKKRIVIEVDGKQHYAEGDIAKPSRYAEMVSLDRELKLLGYEVYRFGGYELTANNEQMTSNFFLALFKKHGLV